MGGRWLAPAPDPHHLRHRRQPDGATGQEADVLYRHYQPGAVHNYIYHPCYHHLAYDGAGRQHPIGSVPVFY